MSESPESIVYQESLRSLTQQISALDGLYARAGTLMSAAAIATSFLGSQALRDRNIEAATLVAIVSFVAVAICNLIILWPRGGWRFTFLADKLLTNYVDVGEPFSVSQIQRDLALHLEDYRLLNAPKIDRLSRWLQWGIGLLIVEIIAWLIDLA